MSLHSRLGPHFSFRIRRRASLSLFALVALTWSNPALSNEIHDAAKDGDLVKVKALLKPGAACFGF